MEIKSSPKEFLENLQIIERIDLEFRCKVPSKNSLLKYDIERKSLEQLMQEYHDQLQSVPSGMRWVRASDGLPIIDHKNPKHYLFLNDVNHNAICIWTEFIHDWPPIINVYKSDWRWLDESGSAAMQEQKDKRIADLENAVKWSAKYDYEKLSGALQRIAELEKEVEELKNENNELVDINEMIRKENSDLQSRLEAKEKELADCKKINKYWDDVA